MRNTKALCQTAVVAALYVALTTLNPLSWGVVQFRVANMLCALPFKDKRYAPAVLLGIAIANATSPFGPVDVLFGLLAEGTAYALVVWGPWKRLGILWKAVILSLSVALFIGVELSMMVGAPFWLTSTGLCRASAASPLTRPLRERFWRSSSFPAPRPGMCPRTGQALFLRNNTTARVDTGTENEEG